MPKKNFDNQENNENNDNKKTFTNIENQNILILNEFKFLK